MARKRTQAPKGAPAEIQNVPPSATVADAERLARSAHAGQKDRAGNPYIDHVARVARATAKHGDENRMTAWLHDIMEDTKTTSTELAKAGFGTKVIRAIQILTRDRENQTYASYIDSISRSRNEIAKRVKRADLVDHLTFTPEVINDALQRRYRMAYEQLGGDEVAQ